MEVGKAGEFDMGFSSDMAFPDAWASKLSTDGDTMAAEANGTLVGRRRLQAIAGLKFYVQKAGRSTPEEIS